MKKGKYANYYRVKHLEMDELDGLRDKKYYGVFLFRDIAWMKPYGGEYDWLGLEARRVQRRDRIGNTQIYGELRLTKHKNPNIRTTSHREKLIENSAYRQLKKLVTKAIGTLENFKKKAEEEDKKEELHEHKDKPEVAKTALVLMESTMKSFSKGFNQILGKSGADIFKMQVKAAKDWVDEFEGEKKKEVEELWQYAQQEAALATLGLMTSYMAKQIAEPLEEASAILAKARKMKEKTELSEKQEWEIIGRLESNTEKIKRFMGFVSTLSKHIADMRRSKSKRRDTDVYKVWSDVYNSMKSRTDELNIAVYDEEQKLKVRMNPIDLYSILSNFYINSIESLRQSKNTKRRIDVVFEWKPAGLKIRFKDNGIGITKTSREEIFTAFVSTADTDPAAYHGQGLGLAIVKHIVNGYKGEVYANPKFGRGDGAEMIIEFPKEEVGKVAAY
jgi:C4-dicarboxylate-specific signal transduction histidine kinase